MPRLPFTALMTLAAAVSLSVTIQMLPMGLLTHMSAELAVSASLVGLTVSVWALAVVLTSAVLTRVTRRIDRRSLVAGLLVLLGLATLLTGLAPNYPVLVVARVAGGVAHGVFWATIGAYSAYLVPREQIGRAVSIVFGGGALAFLAGLPIGAALGQMMGWRTAFLLLAGLAIVGSVLVLRALPSVRLAATADNGFIHPSSAGGVPALPEPSATPRPSESLSSVIVVCLITAVALIGQHSLYTYIEPFLVQKLRVQPSMVGPALAVFGAAGVVALVAVALWFGTRPNIGLLTALGGMLVAALFLGSWPTIAILSYPAFLLWGLTMGMLPTLLQTRLLHASPVSMMDTSSAFFTTAFNIGIGGGAMLGSLSLDAWGLGSLPAVLAGFAVLAVALVLVAEARLHGPPIQGRGG